MIGGVDSLQQTRLFTCIKLAGRTLLSGGSTVSFCHVWDAVYGAATGQPVDPKSDPQVVEARHLLARKQQLLDPENGTLRR